MCPSFEHDEDSKQPRPVQHARKGDGDAERAEEREDDERLEHHHRVIVRC